VRQPKASSLVNFVPAAPSDLNYFQYRVVILFTTTGLEITVVVDRGSFSSPEHIGSSLNHPLAESQYGQS